MKKKLLAFLLIVCITIPLLCLAANHVHVTTVSIVRNFSALNTNSHKVTTTRITTCKQCHQVIKKEVLSSFTESHTPTTKTTKTYSSLNGAYHNIKTTTTISCQKCGCKISEKTENVVDIHYHPLVSTTTYPEKNCIEEIYKCICGHTAIVYTPIDFTKPLIKP